MIYDFFYNNFENPLWLLLIIPLLILLYYYVKKDFINIKLDERTEGNLRKKRIIIFSTRSFIFILLLIALAGPFVEKYTTIHGDPRIKILIDNSTSMNVFDNLAISKLRTDLENNLPVETEYIAIGDKSPLADNILANMKRNENLLLISDGYSNSGLEFGDAALRASNLNATVSAVKLLSKNYDASVAVLGSEKTTSGVDNTCLKV